MDVVKLEVENRILMIGTKYFFKTMNLEYDEYK